MNRKIGKYCNKVICSSNRNLLRKLPENSIDACVTDPPYEINFMGHINRWDKSGISFDPKTWKRVLRVLKPGAYALIFGYPKSNHRVTCAVEDAGFEIRDMVLWMYGSGMPKSHNIKEGEFKGYGSAMKPSYEPIILARKPLSEKTIMQNLLKWRTGAINIERSRIKGDSYIANTFDSNAKPFGNAKGEKYTKHIYSFGRWPSNVILGCSCKEVMMVKINEPNKVTGSGWDGSKVYNRYRDDRLQSFVLDFPDTVVIHTDPDCPGYIIDKQRDKVSRYFKQFRMYFVSKANKKDKGTYNTHSTVKPIDLIKYLIRMVTPPKGIVLDPFAGSFTTAIAAEDCWRRWIACDKEEKYCMIGARRLLEYFQLKKQSLMRIS